jgi:hypothetical protein
VVGELCSVSRFDLALARGVVARQEKTSIIGENWFIIAEEAHRFRAKLPPNRSACA